MITTGTLSGCCGLKIVGAADTDLLTPGDTIHLNSEILGTLENTIAGHGKPNLMSDIAGE